MGVRLRSLVAGFFLVLLAACAVPTPYQPAVLGGSGYGFADQQIEANRYRVTFAGNYATSRDRVMNALLYRAAELTLTTGHDYFIDNSQSVERSTEYTTFVDPFPFYGYGYYGGPYYGGGFASANSAAYNRYTGIIDIVVQNGRKPADNPRAYDARDVIARLAPLVLAKPD